MRLMPRHSSNTLRTRRLSVATKAITSMTPVVPSAKATLGSWAWVLVAGIVPVYRFAAESGMSWLPEMIIGLIAASLLFGRARSLPGAAVWIFAGISIVVAGAISGTSSNITASLRTAGALAVLLGITPFVLRYYFVHSKSFASRAATAFLLVQSISAIAALAQVAGMSVLGASANSGRANGLAGHPNVQGLMSVIAIVLIITVYRSVSPRFRALLVVCGGINLAALIATGSLSSLLSMAAALIVLIAARRAGLRTIFIGSACIVAVIMISLTIGFDPSALFAPVSHRIDVVTGETDGVASLGIRQQTYAFAWTYIQQDPFIGVGMDSMNQGTFNGITVVHNYILHAWYQGGLAMVVAIAAITLLLLRRIVSAMSTGERSSEAAIIAAIIVYALGSAFYDQQQYWLPLLFATVSSYSLRGGASFKKDERAQHGRRTPKQRHQNLHRGLLSNN